MYRGLRVRMGIHYGEPIAQEDPASRRTDYFGPMVNLSARIGGAGHGGQIVVSKAVMAQLTEENLASMGQPIVKDRKSVV